MFGGACLIHDLGMASAAYVDGLASLRREPGWSDAVALVLRGELDRLPTLEEIAAPGPGVIRAAQERVLRELHAEHAERLATISWEGKPGERQHLIEDSLLRATYGPIIGQIAHSHWWPAGELGKRFTHALGAPAGAPATWTVRPLLIASLLRLADASHLDASRSPRFLRAVRRPAAASVPHWEFQEHLSQPYAEGDRFVFSGSSFTIEQAEAWWLCADTLRMVDREFRAVDALLADNGMERFAVRGVAGGDDLDRLAAHVPTDGWTPLDARVRVSNVVRLVERLGGRELYGATPHVPLRELVQNASDAVRARRAVDGRATDWGDIIVRLGPAESDGRRWLEVEDTGVGMSQAVLTGHLLDFATSFWESESVREELPGLLAAAFEPTGQFGIGFFSIFMWSDTVTVTSRKHDAGRADTHVLEFTTGVSRRPLLRVATPAECLRDPGTRIRVHLDEELLWRLGIDQKTPDATALATLCQWLAPALDVNLHVEADGEHQLAISANDWLQIPIEDLGTRLRSTPIRLGAWPGPEEEAAEGDVEEEPDGEEEEERQEREDGEGKGNAEEKPGEGKGNAEQEDGEGKGNGNAEQEDGEGEENAEEKPGEEAAEIAAMIGLPSARLSPATVPSVLKDNARELTLSDGTVVGRALLNPLDISGGVVTAGGFRSTELNNTTGILLGRPTTASRQVSMPLLPVEVLAEWATEQATLLAGKLTDDLLRDAAELVRACRGDPGPLPIAFTRSGPLTSSELPEWAAGLDEILLLHDAELSIEKRASGPIQLREEVVVVGMTISQLLSSNGTGQPSLSTWPSVTDGELVRRSMDGAVVEAVADGWKVPIELLWTSYMMSKMVNRVIGQRESDGADVKLNPGVLIRAEHAQALIAAFTAAQD